MTSKSRTLITYFDNIESELVSRFSQSSSVSQSTIKGQLREHFIADILRRHLPERVQITTNAQIIDRNDQMSSEQDIVLFRDDLPKITIGYRPDLLLAESVIATSQIKSRLTYSEFSKDLDKVKSVRELHRQISSIYNYEETKDRIKCYIVAFEGPKLETLISWISKYLNYDDSLIATLSFDAAWILGSGIVLLDDNFLWPTKNRDYLTFSLAGAAAYLIAHIVFTAGRHPSVTPNIGDYLNPL